MKPSAILRTSLEPVCEAVAAVIQRDELAQSAPIRKSSSRNRPCSAPFNNLRHRLQWDKTTIVEQTPMSVDSTLPLAEIEQAIKTSCWTAKRSPAQAGRQDKTLTALADQGFLQPSPFLFSPSFVLTILLREGTW
jgi:hypothetical protein